MPGRIAYTEDGEAVHVKKDVPLPVTDAVIGTVSTELMSNVLTELKYISAILEECFQTGTEREDLER